MTQELSSNGTTIKCHSNGGMTLTKFSGMTLFEFIITSVKFLFKSLSAKFLPLCFSICKSSLVYTCKKCKYLLTFFCVKNEKKSFSGESASPN